MIYAYKKNKQIYAHVYMILFFPRPHTKPQLQPHRHHRKQ